MVGVVGVAWSLGLQSWLLVQPGSHYPHTEDHPGVLEPLLVPTEVCPLPQLLSASLMSSFLGLGGQEWVQGILALNRLTERLLPQSL